MEVVELPRDALLMHPRSLDAVAPNALSTPRVVLLQLVQQQADQYPTAPPPP